jgi:DNA recombination protein RmuC
MPGGTVLIVVAAAAAAAGALIAAIVVIIALGRRAAAGGSAALEGSLAAAIDSLRLELRATLDGTTQTLNQRLAQSSQETDRRLAELGEAVARRLESTTGLIGQRLEGAAKVVAEVHERLGTVQGAAERVLAVGQSIAELQQILKAPKLRGGLGETFLGELLSQVLPPSSFEMQHGFRGGERVDAVIKVGDRLVPIDAKFPLENFTRMAGAVDDAAKGQARRAFLGDVRRRIDEIAGKYIVPDEGTFDFALMYVPAESVYYETIVRDQETEGGLYEYAIRKRVVPVSPNTFYSYLQVILFGLRGMRIDESAQRILAALAGLGVELEKFRQEFQILGKHIEDALKKHGEVSRRLQRFEDSVSRLEELGEGAETQALPERARDLRSS